MMDENMKQAIEAMEKRLEHMLKGAFSEPIDVEQLPQDLQGLAQKLNEAQQAVQQAHGFAVQISHGELEAEAPGRANYLASPLKEIHSQMTSFCWSIEQLLKGNMVSKLYYPGPLFESYNKLIERVSKMLGGMQADSMEWGTSSITSWRYHQFLSALNHLHIMIVELDQHGNILFLNPPARRAFGGMKKMPYEDEAEQNGALVRYLCSVGNRAEELEEKYLQGEKISILHEIFDPDTGAWYKITSDYVNLTDGSVGLLHMIDDISEWKKYEHELKQSATLDSLTSAYTRKAGLAKIEEMIERREQQRSCVAFVDIDNLKSINDGFGHNEGDDAIKTVVNIVSACVRSTDWVVRFGGDEFLVLFQGCREEEAQKIIDRMLEKLAQMNREYDRGYELSFSVGLAEITQEMQHAADLIEVVDRHMYENKQKNKQQ